MPIAPVLLCLGPGRLATLPRVLAFSDLKWQVLDYGRVR